MRAISALLQMPARGDERAAEVENQDVRGVDAEVDGLTRLASADAGRDADKYAKRRLHMNETLGAADLGHRNAALEGERLRKRIVDASGVAAKAERVSAVRQSCEQARRRRAMIGAELDDVAALGHGDLVERGIGEHARRFYLFGSMIDL